MHKNKLVRFVAAVLVLICWINGCARDPKTRRDRFLDSGQRYFEKGQFDAAAIQFRRAVQVDSRYGESYYRLGLAQLKLRQWQEAYRSFNKTLEVDSAHVAARLELANLELAARQDATARSDAQKVIGQEPSNFRAHLLLGRISLIEKDYNNALQEFEECQRIAPQDPVAFAQAGDTYILINKFPEAKRELERAISVDATFTQAYLHLAEIYRLEGNTEQQVKTLQEAILRSPKQTAAYMALASAYLQLGKRDRVADLFGEFRKETGNAPESLLAIGEFYFATGDTVHAAEVLSQGLEKDSGNNSIRRRLIEVALNQNDPDKAEKLDDELLKREPKDPAGRMFKARIQFERGESQNAVSTLEHLVHDVPEMALPHFYLGLAYARKGEADRAIAAMNDALEHDSNFIWAYLTIGELHLNQHSPKLALEFANRALQMNPNLVPAIILKSNAYMQSGDYNTAAAELERVLTMQPNNPILLERLAVADIGRKQFAGGEQNLEKALAAQPDSVPAMLDLAQLYRLENRSEEIIPRIQQQIGRSSRQEGLHELLGEAYLAKGEHKRAEEEFESAVKLNPDSRLSNLQLARTLAAEKRVSDAIQIAQQIVQKHPDDVSGHFLLGSLYEQSGNVPQAQQAYQQTLDRDAQYVPALNNLAWLLCENGGNLDMALSLAQQAKAKFPNDPNISDTLAWIQFRKGLYLLALPQFRELTETHPQNPVYQYHLGMTLAKLGKQDDARRTLSRALSSQLSGNAVAEANAALASLN